MNYLKSLFTGRINRKSYLYGNLVGLVLVTILYVFRYSNSTVWITGGMLLIIFSFSLGIRRMHDLDRSGWWYFITYLIPLFNILVFIYLLSMSGQQTKNKYGPKPSSDIKFL